MARMSRLLSAVSLGIAVTAAVGAVTAATEFAPVHKSPRHLAESVAAGRVIVKFKERAAVLSAATSATTGAATASGTRTGPQSASELGSRLGLALADGRILGPRTQVMTTAGMSSSSLATALRQDADVEWVEVDRLRHIQAVPSDPLYGNNLSTAVAPTGPVVGQWYLRAPGGAIKSSINIEPAWAITTGSPSIVIGDVDTGITAHPDLDAKMVTGYDFIHNATIANDGSVRDSDPSDAGDYITATENSTHSTPDFFGCADDGVGASKSEPSSWHGTQTAGILGASTDNAAGIAGTSWGSPLIPARALGKCGGYDSDIIAAAQWAAGIAVSGVPANGNPARVINMSLGGTGDCGSAYQDALTALRNKGVFVVVAAGNDEGLPVDAPANCQPATTDSDQTPLVIAVAGLRHAGTKVGFSDIGTEVTIAAPGGNCINTAPGTPCLYPIVTTSNSGSTAPVTNGGIYTDGLNDPSLGTSFATPMVAGTVALMLSTAPTLTNAQVVNILKNTAVAFPTVSDTVPNPAVCTVPTATSAAQDECICTTKTCGAGMLDAGAAVVAAHAATGGTGPTATVSPTTSSVVIGATVALGGTDSTIGTDGSAVVRYQWDIVDGGALIGLDDSAGSRAVVTGVAAGTAHVRMTAIDASGRASTATAAVTVTDPAVTPPSGGGGGGAANPAWLVALALAGLLLGPRARRARA